jgi:hypothetical protein
MSDARDFSSTFCRGLRLTRTLAAWVALVAALSVVIVTTIIYYKYPYAHYVPSPPAMPRWVLIWRNWSIVTGLVLGLLSLPKW